MVTTRRSLKEDRSEGGDLDLNATNLADERDESMDEDDDREQDDAPLPRKRARSHLSRAKTDRKKQEIVAKQEEFQQAGDKEGLLAWETERRKDVRARRELAIGVLEYLRDSEISRAGDLESLKTERRKTITERLSGLGWTDQDMSFGSAYLKPWHTLVNAPKPLTERTWTNISPKLTQLLEENCARHIARAKEDQRIERCARVDKFLMDMKYKEHPFEPIFIALGSPTPEPPDFLAKPSGMLRMFLLNSVSPVVPSPFPRTETILEWDFMEDLSEVDMSIQEVEAKLLERKQQLETRISDWRESIEEQLVKNLGFRPTRIRTFVLWYGASGGDLGT
ncbi:valine-tRNA ligase [Ceratobasidium sp. AG-Ba]|nr:valine-tRNA ligase [Ceratobasidium sp. AG-Ba]